MSGYKPLVKIYTDGSCKDGEGGWSACLFYKNDSLFIADRASDTTNNRMELTAVIEALSRLITPCYVILYSDSKYVLDGMQYMYAWNKRKWKTKDKKDVSNADLWKKMIEVCDNGGHTIKKKWVKGHTGNINNETCDSLAKYIRDHPEMVEQIR